MLKTQGLWFVLLLLTATPTALADEQVAWDGNFVIYITGGPISTQPENVNESAVELKEEIQREYPNVHFDYRHNSQYKDICESIKAKRAAHNMRTGRIAIVGHSYGASATTVISRCLQEDGIQVDIAIMMDMINRPIDKKADVIPDNIRVAMNYYQTKDVFFRGRKNVRREDGSHKGITNTKVDEKLGAAPHFGLINHLMVDTHTVEDAILETLRR